ncbi:MAG: hypothetical protein QOJ78_155 [Pseudonocardiales bacterium]|jgi:hypothetical protein|nr:hypothetical protein [Pseudonocardiales bacterium]MDT4930452.1 hypothetical protein [Pseudonocardiales bacterium]
MSTWQLAGALAKSGEAVKAGPIGLAVILILCIACYFLFKSMSKHLKAVRENFPTDESSAVDPGAETPIRSADPSATTGQASMPARADEDENSSSPPAGPQT